jgi:ornithine carbamoyltransferase
MTRHFLRDDDLTPAEQTEVLALAQKALFTWLLAHQEV